MKVPMYLKASNPEKMANGLLRVEVELAELSEADHKTIDRLLPNLSSAFYLALNKEAMLAAIPSEFEITAAIKWPTDEPPAPPYDALAPKPEKPRRRDPMIG